MWFIFSGRFALFLYRQSVLRTISSRRCASILHMMWRVTKCRDESIVLVCRMVCSQLVHDGEKDYIALYLQKEWTVSKETLFLMNSRYSIVRQETGSYQRPLIAHQLSGKALVDPLIKCATRWMHSEILFVLLEHLQIMAGEIRELVDITDLNDRGGVFVVRTC
jgi:hypothetical protein